MGSAPSDKQIAFRESLIRRYLGNAKASARNGTPGVTDWDVLEAGQSPDAGDWYIGVAGQKIADAAFVLAFPEPATAAECSDQIGALQHGGGFAYARDHMEWGQEILARIAARWGEDQAALPRVVTVRELRAVATGAGNA